MCERRLSVVQVQEQYQERYVFWNAKRQGLSNKKAFKEAAKAGATALGGGVLTQQTTAATKTIKPVVESAMKIKVGEHVLTKTASVIAGKQVTRQAAVNVLTETARTNAVTSAAMFVATSVPDTVKLCRGKISGADYAENMASNAAGISGGWAGAALGTAICPGVGRKVSGFLRGKSR